MRVEGRDEPDALHVVLAGLHVDVYAPEVPSFWMRVDDALEQRLSALRFAQFIFQLSKFGDGLDVCANQSRRELDELREKTREGAPPVEKNEERTFTLF